MKILVSGTWHPKTAEEYRSQAYEVGDLLAKRGHILVTGAGTGMSELVVNGYKQNKGEKYVAILTSKEQREAVGEELGPEPDEIIETNMDYPSRNVELVKYCDAIIALPGSLGSLTEVIHAINDYGKSVVVLSIGPLADMIKHIPGVKEKVFLTENIKEMVDYLEKKA